MLWDLSWEACLTISGSDLLLYCSAAWCCPCLLVLESLFRRDNPWRRLLYPLSSPAECSFLSAWQSVSGAYRRFQTLPVALDGISSPTCYPFPFLSDRRKICSTSWWTWIANKQRTPWASTPYFSNITQQRSLSLMSMSDLLFNCCWFQNCIVACRINICTQVHYKHHG